MVCEDKVVMFMQLVITPRRVNSRVPKAPAVSREVANMATRLEIPADDIDAMLDDDHVDPERDVPPELQQPGSEGSAMKWTTVDTWMSAIAELYNTQKSLGRNKYPNFRGAALNGLLDAYKRGQHARDRDAFEDRGATGITSGYTDDEFLQLNRVLLAGAHERTGSTNLRTRVDVLLGHFLVLRGQSRRDAELSELCHLSVGRGRGDAMQRARPDDVQRED
jgi:hypothetical protein